MIAKRTLIKLFTIINVYGFIKYMQNVHNVKIEINGCGPEGYGWLVPDLNISKVCHWHDVAYHFEAYHIATVIMQQTVVSRFYGVFTRFLGRDNNSYTYRDRNMMIYINKYIQSDFISKMEKDKLDRLLSNA